MKTKHFIVVSGLVLICIAGIVLIVRKMSFKHSLIKIAKTEVNKWKGLTELSKDASKILVDYWKSVGRKFTSQQMQSSIFQANWPWSSAFISWLFFKAGAGNRFPYSASHAGYFQLAKKNRDVKNAALRGFRISEYAPKVGDLVVYSRSHGKNYDSKGFFASHGEVVIGVGKGFIRTVGGNVSNSVSESTFRTNAQGLLVGNRKAFFMVIENNIK